MQTRLLLPAVLVLTLLVAPVASAADYVPGEVIVKYRAGADTSARATIERKTGTRGRRVLPGGSRKLAIADGESVRDTVAQLKRSPKVAYAVPNHIARASALIPNDPGYRRQWNFSGAFGINMPEAWSLARRRHAPGGRGSVVAVLDSGVAYRSFGRRYRRAPDLRSFVKGHDFVDGDSYPLDLYGHGTHVAGTIAQSTNNGKGAAGIAYRSKIMPVRVLDAEGGGDTVAIARGIRYAARRHVDVINLSLEFDPSVRASQIPDLFSALRFARRRGVTVVAGAGNLGDVVVAYPARAKQVIAVAATTKRGCQASYSNAGEAIDVAAPGGGADADNADNPWDAAHCRPGRRGSSIFQQTFTTSPRRFGLPSGYEGTSMAAPHVSGIVALIAATRRLGSRRPGPKAIEAHLKATARDAGAPGFDERYGYGIVDAAAALR